jgi:hypothetical protein
MTMAVVRRFFQSLRLSACLVFVVSAVAQEGHPLTGTWSGDWGPTPTERHHLTIVMNWDGKNVTGMINPGPDATPITSVFVDLPSWTVRIQASGKDPSGNPARIEAEGKLEDLGSAHRKMSGTWSQGTSKGDFRITRD